MTASLNTFAGLLCLAATSAAAATAAVRPILAINEDNDHYFKLDSSRMTKEALEAYVDDLARGHVTHFFMCPQGQRASFDSKSWEPIWAGLNDPDNKGRTNNIWCVNAKKLHDAGIDPYAVWTARCRAKGIRPWLSMRMNDPHFTDTPAYFRHTSFWREHPELWRYPHSDAKDQGVRWTDCTFDYAHKEVRDYHLAMVRELIERYDADGLELDWMRSPPVFKRGESRRYASLLTEFVRQVRRIASEKEKTVGRRYRLGVRVPTLPSVCAGYGMDVLDWAKEGLIDLVVVANSYHVMDYDIPFVEWRERLAEANPKVALLPSADIGVRCGVPPGGKHISRQFVTVEQYRGWAEALYAQGAKGVYLFNRPYRDAATRAAVYGEGLSPEMVRARPRTYMITERHDCLPDGGVSTARLPVTINGNAATPGDLFFPVRIGVPPTKGRVDLVVGFSRRDDALADVTYRLNGEMAAGEVREEDDPSLYGTIKRCEYAVRIPFAASSLVPGVNGVEVLMGQRRAAGVRISWVSIEVPGKESGK